MRNVRLIAVQACRVRARDRERLGDTFVVPLSSDRRVFFCQYLPKLVLLFLHSNVTPVPAHDVVRVLHQAKGGAMAKRRPGLMRTTFDEWDTLLVGRQDYYKPRKFRSVLLVGPIRCCKTLLEVFVQIPLGHSACRC